MVSTPPQESLTQLSGHGCSERMERPRETVRRGGHHNNCLPLKVRGKTAAVVLMEAQRATGEVRRRRVRRTPFAWPAVEARDSTGRITGRCRLTTLRYSPIQPFRPEHTFSGATNIPIPWNYMFIHKIWLLLLTHRWRHAR